MGMTICFEMEDNNDVAALCFVAKTLKDMKCYQVDAYSMWLITIALGISINPERTHLYDDEFLGRPTVGYLREAAGNCEDLAGKLRRLADLQEAHLDQGEEGQDGEVHD